MSIRDEDFQDIIEYYDRTRFDYRVAWDNSPTPAVHFGFYDREGLKHTEALMNTNRVLADWVAIQAGERVLDAGCGKGGSCFWLALHRGVEATGITPVQSQIDDCKQQAATLGLEDRTHFLRADYCATPFEAASFDVVWACESLCHAPEKSRFYREAYRLLRPGGRLIIAEYLRQTRPLSEPGEQQLRAWLHRWAITDIDTRDEHLDHARKAGFTDVAIEDVTANTQVSLRNLHRNSSNWLWLSKILLALRLRSRVQHANMYASIVQYEALRAGHWFYAVISARKA